MGSMSGNRSYASERVKAARDFMDAAWTHRSFESLLWAVHCLVQAAEADMAAKTRRKPKGKYEK